MYYFAAYVRTQEFRTRDMLAYCLLIIQEALQNGGNGWQEYDRSFRCQVAIEHPTLKHVDPRAAGSHIWGTRSRSWYDVYHLSRTQPHSSLPVCFRAAMQLQVTITLLYNFYNLYPHLSTSLPLVSHAYMCLLESGHMRLPRDLYLQTSLCSLSA